MRSTCNVDPISQNRARLVAIKTEIAPHKQAIETLEAEERRLCDGIQAHRRVIQAEAEAKERKRLDAERAEQAAQAKAKALEPLDARIAQLRNEQTTVRKAGNLAGAAALEVEIEKLKERRAVIAAAA